MPEIWKDILGYEGFYEVSDLGRIRTKERRVPTKGDNKTRLVKAMLRKTFPNKQGYPIVTLSRENKLATFTVHQLVAQAFIPGFIKGTELNHIDGDKGNPAASNLEVSNPSHNQLHAVRTGLRPKTGVSSYRYVYYVRSPKAKARWAAAIRHAGQTSYGWKTFMTEEEAARYADDLLDSIGDTSRKRNFRAFP